MRGRLDPVGQWVCHDLCALRGGDEWDPSYLHTASNTPAPAAFESPGDGAGLQQWPVVTKNQPTLENCITQMLANGP